jgi:disulfide bond formation protein DsbB
MKLAILAETRDPATDRRYAAINHAAMLLMMAAIAAILTVAMTFQYMKGELPCPLCLLERVALFGVCFGIMRNFRHGFAYRNTGLSLLWTIFLLVVSVRQSLLDIYPRPGHAYVGSPIFGLHMPVWSIVIALALLTAYAIKVTLVGNDAFMRTADIVSFPRLKRLADAVSLYVIALLLINAVSVVVQCGFGACSTFGYKLLQ